VNNHKKQGRFPIKGWSPEECFEETGWIWNERDLKAVLFGLLKKHLEKMPIDLDVHLEVALKDIISMSKWEEMKKIFKAKERIVDVVITHIGKTEDEPLDLCAELKYWDHFDNKVPKFRTFRKDWLCEDIKKLEKLLKLKICTYAYFCYLDERYCNKESVKKDLISFLNSKEKETGVKCLYGWVSKEQFLAYLREAQTRQ